MSKSPVGGCSTLTLFKDRYITPIHPFMFIKIHNGYTFNLNICYCRYVI